MKSNLACQLSSCNNIIIDGDVVVKVEIIINNNFMTFRAIVFLVYKYTVG